MDKLSAYFDENSTDFIYHIDLLNQTIETQADIIGTHVETINELRKHNHITTNALRIYANKFGHSIIAERGIEDGVQFELTTTLLPVDKDHVSVEVTVKGIKNDDKHYRRRSKYQTIKDWLMVIRQSLQKPKR
jgi:hypothetical protein